MPRNQVREIATKNLEGATSFSQNTRGIHQRDTCCQEAIFSNLEKKISIVGLLCQSPSFGYPSRHSRILFKFPSLKKIHPGVDYLNISNGISKLPNLTVLSMRNLEFMSADKIQELFSLRNLKFLDVSHQIESINDPVSSIVNLLIESGCSLNFFSSEPLVYKEQQFEMVNVLKQPR
ncbi:hypothetical protein CAEBREN_21467 [Caenorhabditis brenneri]|uniref:Uncharacterized protein n=1 Tax=Caenorhabditis brenneri TaxID=135651 RepID=G0PNR9_CAEBE|nr:hypothetical protein CAEBREN_21467 [Caenorhabditis brenneri]